MRVYRVVIDSDGETKKEPGKVETELKRTEFFFAASSIGDVYNASIKEAVRLGGEIVAVVEVCPSLTIL